MQHINLLERKAPTGLASPNTRRAALAAALLATLCAAAYLVQTQELRSLRADLERVQAQSEHLHRAILEVPSPDLALSDRLATEESQVQSMEAVARTLSTGGLAHTTGFASTLRAFGHTATDGIWLTGITLDNRRGSMVVEGRALDASRVPALLQTLKAEPYFAGITFAAIEMTAGVPNSASPAERALKFRVATPTADVEIRQPSASTASGEHTASTNAPDSNPS
jgi:Tfp pilus assembly protein PilN